MQIKLFWIILQVYLLDALLMQLILLIMPYFLLAMMILQAVGSLKINGVLIGDKVDISEYRILMIAGLAVY